MTNQNTNKQTQTNVRVSRHDQRQTHTNKCSSSGGIGLVILGRTSVRKGVRSYPILHIYFLRYAQYYIPNFHFIQHQISTPPLITVVVIDIHISIWNTVAQKWSQACVTHTNFPSCHHLRS